MNRSPSETTFMIVGAGLAGSLMACLLAKRGYRVVMYERRPDPRSEGFIGGRSINLALSTRGIEALKRVDLADRVLADAIPMRGRMMHGPDGSLTFQPYSKRPGDAINSVSRGGLNITLLDAAEDCAEVEIHFEHRCVEIDLEAPSATFENPSGEMLTVAADAIIGADGAFSAVRNRLQRQARFDYSQEFLDHGYKELTIPPTPESEFAIEPNALHIWPRGGYMMIALPNKDRSFTCTLFWPFEGPNSFDAVRSDEEISAFFRANFPDAGPIMPTLLEDYHRNPVSPLVTIRCHPWVHDDKVALLGDSAHAIVPFYGQGMNAAFEDAGVLADCLDRHPDDRAAAFAHYSEMRKENADAIADMAVDNFHEMRDKVASRAFVVAKKLEKTVHRWFPGWYTPLYNMVTFTTIPYAEARRRAKQQNQVLAAAGVLFALTVLLVIVGVVAAAVDLG
ncbi:MAG: FAD-dependent oxidoreductase [Phycisphaerales bacterium]